MIQFFKELYLTGFAIAFRLRAPERLGGGWGPIVDAGKGIAAVSLIELVIIRLIQDWIEISIGKRFSFDSNRLVNSAIFLVFYLVNYYFLVSRKHGLKFEREFSHLKKTRKVLLLVGCAMIFLATVVFSEYTLPVYWHYFHL